MAESANGSTATFDSTALGTVRDISWTENGNPIDVTDLGDTNHIFEVGITDIECTLTVVGGEDSAAAVGDSGTLAISWNDGSSESATMVCTNRETSGSLDSEITTNYTFKPSA